MVRDNPEINKRVAEMTALGGAGVPDDIGPMIASLAHPQKPGWTAGQRSKVSGGMFFGDNQSNLAAQLSRLVSAASGGEKATLPHASRSSSTLAVSKALGRRKSQNLLLSISEKNR
jgi:hypothetical protein